MRKQNKLSFKRTPERVELIKKMVDKDPQVAKAAQMVFAQYIRPAVQVCLNQRAIATTIYRDLPYSKYERPTIPLDIFSGTRENYVSIWSQNVAGGLATNVIQGLQEYTFQPYRLESAVAFYNQALENANLPILATGLDRMINEIVVKQERNAWSPLLSAVATATTNGLSHVINSTIPGRFLPDDINALFTLIDRLFVSYAFGTPDGALPSGLTDLFVSPEIVGQIRSFAFNPVNTRGGFYNDSGTETETPGFIPLPSDMREKIYTNAGMMSIYDVDIHKVLELGKNQKYNTVFDNFYQGTFNPATQEVLLGFDLSRDVFLRPVITDDDWGGGDVLVLPDDQFFARSEKSGFFCRLEESRVLMDDRAEVALIV